ncbi:uncharacterized protein LOC115325591 [Ixodes scapularis]|uniref:uncharacterized protein LOC115325591 n=1 Tax=Ixodes scapularis TaxID=6945 RepID=UPI001A9E8566|nr:uncharacterized protein LOC115325591 [Ixodes scapularis]
MYLQSLLATFCLLMGSYSQETDPLPEEDPKNFPNQDARKVYYVSGKQWVKWRTYTATTPPGGYKCEYAQIVGGADGEGEKNYTLEVGGRIGETWIRVNQTLVLKKSGSHPQPNVMQFQRNPDDGIQEHKLLYSDYDSCSIIRITRKTEGLFCDLLLFRNAADAEPPSPCKEKFEEYCKGDRVEVYTSDCGTQQEEAA